MSIAKVNEMFLRLKELYVRSSRLLWTQYTIGYDFGIEEAYKEINEFFESKENFEVVLETMNEELEAIDRRRVEIAYNLFKPFHLSKEVNDINLEIRKRTNELSKILNTFRFKLDGKEVTSVEIDQILRNEENRDLRRKAYFSRNQINKALVDGGFIELINLRKELAKAYGAEDFVKYKLEMDELEPGIFDGWKEDLREHIDHLNPRRREYAEKYINQEELLPWDEAFVKSKISPSLKREMDMSKYYKILREFFLEFGFDLDKYNITYDIFPRRNKSEWGYNFTIETGKDSRILANVKNQYSEFKVLLHETGHAIHSFLLDPDEIILNAGVSGIITEGIANLFGNFLFDRLFYNRFFDDRVKEEFDEIKEYEKLDYVRFVGNIFFDQALYRNDIKSLDDIYKLYFKVFSDLFEDKAYDEEPPFGYRIHYTTHPIYMHNYFMGDVTNEMLRKVFCRRYEVKYISDKPKEFGAFLLNEVIKPSGLYKFEELFKRISGEEFSLKWYF